jgi:pimeloyl-ACP methyl ester carboxylesterase
VLSEDDFKRLRAMLTSGVPAGAAEHFVRSLSRPGRLTAALNYYRANLTRGHAWGGMRHQVNVTAPTILLWGDQDPALGRLQAENTARYMTGEYRLEVLEGAGHWLQFERPDQVGRSLVDGVSK